MSDMPAGAPQALTLTDAGDAEKHAPSLTDASRAEKHESKRPPKGSRKLKKGLVLVNTGHGKGKSTAAFGLMLRAWGRGMRVGVIQFIKHENSKFGEQRAAKKLGIEMVAMGDGFTWVAPDIDASAAKARHGWAMAQERISSGDYDVVILDEFTYPLNYGWLDTSDVVAWLRANKPEMLHLVITGRNAPEALIEYADLVSEITAIKHPLQQGIRGQAGIEY